jgi:hypothetical protein
VPHVVPITLCVALKFRECEVIRIEGEQTDVLETPRGDFRQPFLIAVGHDCHTNKLKIYLVLPVKIRTLTR